MSSSLLWLLSFLFLLLWFLFGWQDKLLALGIMQTINGQQVLLQHSPHYKLGLPHLWGRVSSVQPSDCTMASILSLLVCVCINRCAAGWVTSWLVLCRTELDAPVFREQNVVSFKCLFRLRECQNSLHILFSIILLDTFLLQKSLFLLL